MYYFYVQNKILRWIHRACIATLALVIFASNAALHISHNHSASSCCGGCALHSCALGGHYVPHTCDTHVENGNCVSCTIINHLASSAPILFVFEGALEAFPRYLIPDIYFIHVLSVPFTALRASPC